MRRLVWGIAGRTNRIVENLMSRLNYIIWDLKIKQAILSWFYEDNQLHKEQLAWVTQFTPKNNAQR